MMPNESFQHYQVLRRADGTPWELGRGAMGITYKAMDTSLHRAVALKVIQTGSLHHERAQQRFVREARAAAGLNHPNVARVFHLGESAQSYFYAMEFIDGETVEARVRRVGPLPVREALFITLQVALALRAAAREGLIHRDIKPSNVMLLHEQERGEEPHVKVIDFGLAKVARGGTGDEPDGAGATITVAGFVGTPHYASPEQLDEREVDARSDFYSLGTTLWYMLTGKPPFGGSVVQVMSQHLSRQPPFDTLPELPGDTRALLRRLLQKDPMRRPQDAGELRREVERALQECGDPGAAFPAAATISADGTDGSGGASRDRHEPTPAPAPAGRRGGWYTLLVLILLGLGFVVVAGGVALAAWYVLGPEENLPAPARGSGKVPRVTPGGSPVAPPGMRLGLPLRF